MWTRLTDLQQIDGSLQGKFVFNFGGNEHPLLPPTDIPNIYRVKEVRDDMLVFTQSGQNYFSISGHAVPEILNGAWWLWKQEEGAPVTTA